MRSRGRWLGWAGWAGIAALVAVAAWLFPDPFGIGESQPSSPPGFVGQVTPDQEELYRLLAFLESHETNIVHLELEVPATEKDIDVSQLFPTSPSQPSRLVIKECTKAHAGCTIIALIIDADPAVERRVFDPGEPVSYIRGYFIVSEYSSQQSSVDVHLKPISAKDVGG